jgi:hypothetical protein
MTPKLHGSLTTESVKIGPKEAARLLGLNVSDNRRLNKGHVATLARQMRLGLWAPNLPDGLSFSVSGKLLNGQHRLHAVLASKTEHVFRVTWNVPEVEGALALPFDELRVRSVSDRTNLDHQASALVGFLLRTCLTGSTSRSRKVLSDHALRLYEVLRPHDEALRAACGARTRGFSSAAVRSAVAFRHKNAATDTDKGVIESAYRALVLMHVEDMPPSVGRILKTAVQRKGSGDDMRMFALAWTAFDPRNFNKARTPILSDKEAAEIVRAETLRALPDAAQGFGV